MKGASSPQGGEVVQVKGGGHILRSTGGRKDRHSKVYTSKGPRDRRVRLSAHTAIQFYDVQDRLGYDRPSKAVDWLIRKAKAAIDNLTDLPPSWPNPEPQTAAPSTDSNPSSNDLQALDRNSDGGPSVFALIQSGNGNPGSSSSSFMPPPPAGEAGVVSTMKSFFPTSSLNSFPGFANEAAAVQLQPRAADLGLSLHSEYGNSGSFCPEGYHQRINGWSGGGMSPQAAIEQHALFCSQGLLFSHRELLQSNLGDHSWNQRPLPNSVFQHQSQSSDFGNPFDFGFGIPGRIYGEEEPESQV